MDLGILWKWQGVDIYGVTLGAQRANQLPKINKILVTFGHTSSQLLKRDNMHYETRTNASWSIRPNRRTE